MRTRTIKATGRGQYCRTNVNGSGFPVGYVMCPKRVYGFQAGDMVRAAVPEGARKGIHVGRVGLRARGSFKVGIVNDISWKHCRLSREPTATVTPPPSEHKGQTHVRGSQRARASTPGMNAGAPRAPWFLVVA